MDEQRFKVIADEFLALIQKVNAPTRGSKIISAPMENGLSVTPVHEDGTVGKPVFGYAELTQARGCLEAIITVIGPSGSTVWWERKSTEKPKIRQAATCFQDQVYAAYRVVYEERKLIHANLAKKEIGDVPSGVSLERKADDVYELQFYARAPLTQAQAKAIIDVIREQIGQR